MRRGINDRKKKRILLKEINLRSLQLIIILTSILIICCLLYFFFIHNFFIQKIFEKESINISNLNQDIPFSIKKIILFSSVTAETSTVNQSISELDVSQYCDIGIYLNTLDKENISTLYIDDIHISSPTLGVPYLYKKTVPDLGKCSFNENNIIKDKFEFNIVNTGEELNYDNYELYNDFSTPISLGFYNKNIKTGVLLDNYELLYNGALLKEARIPLSNLDCTVSFRINVVTSLGEHYISNVSFEIPFEDEKGSIYDTGYTIKEYNSDETNKFIRIK